MKNRSLFFSAMIVASVAGLLLSGCQKDSVEPSTSQSAMPQSAIAQPSGGPGTSSGSMASRNSGISTAIPAYYDAILFKILFVEFSSQAEANLIAHNKSLNFIYQSDPGLPGNQPFISVIDAVPGDGMNPVWREVQITFNFGFTPRQLFSDDEVEAAAAGLNPEITLTMTDEVYWCPVIANK